jgi:hypothetical protein
MVFTPLHALVRHAHTSSATANHHTVVVYRQSVKLTDPAPKVADIE